MTKTVPSLRAARGTMSRRASSFAVAARLLPADVRDDIELLYATFRRLDDLVDDGEPDAAERVAAVRAWADHAAVDDTPEVIVLDALANRHDIPRSAIADFCDGMVEDLAGPRIATDAELDRYCYRVAGTVGVVMAAMLGARAEREAYDCAAALGRAMQLTNILRDVDEDAAVGRVYVPGLADATADRAAILRREIARADDLYDDGLLGVPLLRRGRAAVTLAAGLYREILRELERGDLRAGPVRVSPGRRALTAVRLVLTGR